MNINIDEATRRDIEKFWALVEEKDEKWFQEYQEHLFTIIALLLNKKFRKKILSLRETLKVPHEWYTSKKQEDWIEEYDNYNKNHPDEALITPHDPRIIEICSDFRINVKRYYDFIVD